MIYGMILQGPESKIKAIFEVKNIDDYYARFEQFRQTCPENGFNGY